MANPTDCEANRPLAPRTNAPVRAGAFSFLFGLLLHRIGRSIWTLILLFSFSTSLFVPTANAAPKRGSSSAASPGSWISNEHLSPRNLQRPIRKSTRYIILHTTEGPGAGSIAKLSKNGECNYVIDTDGKVYRIISHNRTAFHAGLSMWNGKTGLDSCSIGIEIVGYHNRDITNAQYASAKRLLAELKRMYKIRDENVLTHSMVAYGNPNHWQKFKHRGRKRCGMLLALPSARARMGLFAKPAYDPDVRAGRLYDADKELSSILYRKTAISAKPTAGLAGNQPPSSAKVPPAPSATSAGSAPVAPPPADNDDVASATRELASASNFIGPGRSAWDIARDAYDASTTIYTFPNGTRKTGTEITNWKSMPAGTKVEIGLCSSENTNEGLLTIGEDGSAQELAGDSMLASSTFYFPEKGPFLCGSELSLATVDALPAGTRMLIGYRVFGPITPHKPVFSLCGPRWCHPDTYYRTKNGHISRGDEIGERTIPEGAYVFVKIDH